MQNHESQNVPSQTGASAVRLTGWLATTLLVGLNLVTAQDLVSDVPSSAELDPSFDGWQSEVLGEQVGSRLAELAKLLVHPEEFSSKVAARFATPQFHGGPLRANSTRRVFRDQQFVVERGSEFPSRELTATRGPELLATQVGELLSPFLPDGIRLVKFKVIGVSRRDGGCGSDQLLTIHGDTAEGLKEIHGHLHAEWSMTGPGAAPMLAAWHLTDLRSATAVGRHVPCFHDDTEKVLAGVEAYHSQLRLGIDEWSDRMEAMLTAQFGHHGLAVCDVNDDGRDDLFVCQPGGLPNLLLLQQPDGTVRDASRAAGLDVLDLSRSALFVDFDNDGDKDLALTTSSQLVIFEQDSAVHFRPTVRLPGVRDANSLAAADFDGDGDVDLYVCVYSGDGGDSRESPTPLPIHDARNGGRNLLFRNEVTAGKWKFTDVTTDVGLDQENNRWSYAASWEDYDNDGDPDLLVANDFGRNSLYRNDGGSFREVSVAAGIDASAFGMSAAWGDFDRDGWMDPYLGNMYSGAGHRITSQPEFQPGASAEVRRKLRGAAQGNTLYRNRGDGTFEDVSDSAGVRMGRWSWGSVFGDLNNDGWEDLIIGNGFVTRSDPDDL